MEKEKLVVPFWVLVLLMISTPLYITTLLKQIFHWGNNNNIIVVNFTEPPTLVFNMLSSLFSHPCDISTQCVYSTISRLAWYFTTSPLMTLMPVCLQAIPCAWSKQQQLFPPDLSLKQTTVSLSLLQMKFFCGC